jgi:RNA-directed DNA polymerase
MGKRPAGVELFEGNMASMQWEIRPSIQRDGTPTMETGLERIAERARCEPKLRFTSLAHHITEDRVWKSLCQIPNHSAPGVDGQRVTEAKESFEGWVGVMLQSIHRKGYRAPDIRRVYIPKPGKQEKRPLGVPTVSDRALQRSTSQVLSAVYEQDFLPCSFGGRPGLGAHHALATLTEVIAGSKVGWVLEADLKNFFGSLDHDWLLQFVRHRIGDPRLISLIGRWLKAGVLEDGVVTPSETGTPQGGSISVLLSNVYLHYVLDLWFERVAKPRLRGEAYLVRYIDDFVVCFQYREDALRLEDALRNRLERFGLTLEPTKTKLVEFGRFAQRHAGQTRQKAPGNHLLPGLHALLHAQPEGQLQGWGAHREVTLAAQPHVTAREDAADEASHNRTTGRRAQRRLTRSLRILRHCRKFPCIAKGVPARRALLVWDASQPQLGGPAPHLDRLQSAQGEDPAAATKAAVALQGAAGSRSTVNQRPKSVVQQICTLRSVGVGGG